MKTSYTLPTLLLLTAGMLSLLHAQVAPAPPTHLRVVSGLPTIPQPPSASPAPKGPAHEYFNALIDRPEHYYSHSLRNQTEVDVLTSDKDASTTWTYSPYTDTYPDAQDALKFTRINPPEGELGHGKGSVPQHDMLLFPQLGLGPESDSVLFTWDQYWGPEFRDNAGGISHFKTVGIEATGHSWWTSMQSPGESLIYTDELDDVASLTDEFQAGAPAPAGMERWERVLPSGSETPPQYPGYKRAGRMYEARWTRFWLEIKPCVPPEAFVEWNATYGVTVQPNPSQPTGCWHMVSKWMADEKRDVRRLLYRVPMGFKSYAPTIGRIRFTMDSSKTGFIGPWIGYFRNLVVLRNYPIPKVNPEQDTFLFQRPIR